jgi:hypothetical protein
MTSAIDTLRHRLPAGAPVLVDYQTSLLLAYYLRDGGVGPFPVVRGDFGVVPVGTVRMLVWATWNFSADSLGGALKRLEDDCTLSTGQTLWVMDAGWGPRLREGATTFGDNIALFTVEVPSPRSGV